MCSTSPLTLPHMIKLGNTGFQSNVVMLCCCGCASDTIGDKVSKGGPHSLCVIALGWGSAKTSTTPLPESTASKPKRDVEVGVEGRGHAKGHLR